MSYWGISYLFFLAILFHGQQTLGKINTIIYLRTATSVQYLLLDNSMDKPTFEHIEIAHAQARLRVRNLARACAIRFKDIQKQLI